MSALQAAAAVFVGVAVYFSSKSSPAVAATAAPAAATSSFDLVGYFGDLFNKLENGVQSIMPTVSGKLSPLQVHGLAQNIIGSYGFNVSAEMATAVAIVESGDVANPRNGIDPGAYRYESALGDASTGLMQTLLKTAVWLSSIGYSAYGIPTSQLLARPEASMYFGTAYLDWLSKYKGKLQDDAWIVQSYNAGPGHAAAAYLAKYNKARLWLQQNGV